MTPMRLFVLLSTSVAVSSCVSTETAEATQETSAAEGAPVWAFRLRDREAGHQAWRSFFRYAAGCGDARAAILWYRYSEIVGFTPYVANDWNHNRASVFVHQHFAVDVRDDEIHPPYTNLGVVPAAFQVERPRATNLVRLRRPFSDEDEPPSRSQKRDLDAMVSTLAASLPDESQLTLDYPDFDSPQTLPSR